MDTDRGPDVSLLNTEQAQAAFVAPAMDEEGTLSFQLKVTDASGRTATDTTRVTVAAGEMPASQPQVFHVCGETDEEFRTEALTALFEAREGDLIEMCAGEFNLTTGLILNSRRGITIRGQSDAGIYVGQSNDCIIRNTLATYNVAGFEFENTYRGVYENNVARDNTGGFLVLLDQLGLLGLVDELEQSDPGLLDELEGSI